MPTTRLPELRPPLPLEVQIEPVGQCNLRCVMCLIRFRRDGPPFGSSAFMRMGLFTQLVDQFPAAASLHLQGLGEPLLHPRIFEMVAYAVRRGMSVTTNSNLLLLDRERAEACVRSGLAWIRVSIDGASAETYEAIRSGARLGVVLEHVRLLQRAKERLASDLPRVFLVMVAMNRNIRELPAIIRLAHDYGMEQVFVQHLCNDFSDGKGTCEEPLMAEFMERESLRKQDPQWIEDRFREAEDVAAKLKIELRLPQSRPLSETGGDPARKRCDWPWRAAYITYTGTAMPCCMIALPDRINLGSMDREGVLAVWHGERYRRFRRKLGSNTPPGVCRTCSIYRGSF